LSHSEKRAGLTPSAKDRFQGNRLAGAEDHNLDFVAWLLTAQKVRQVFQILHFVSGEFDDDIAFAKAGERSRASVRDPREANALLAVIHVRNAAEIDAVTSRFSGIVGRRPGWKADEIQQLAHIRCALSGCQHEIAHLDHSVSIDFLPGIRASVIVVTIAGTSVGRWKLLGVER